MSPLLGRLIVHDPETHLEPDLDAVAVGDVFEVIRGNGPREGELMGTATVARFEADGSPVFDLHFDGTERT